MDSAFFFLSKILWSLVSPDALFLYLLLATFVCLCRQKIRLATLLLGSALAGLLLLALLPVGNWLLSPLEQRFATNPTLPPQVDGIILLGGSIKAQESAAWGQVELNEASERNLAFIALARRYPAARLLMSGGSGSILEQEFREADVARELFAMLGLDPARIGFERDSRNTYENAGNSKALMAPQAGETWILVTSAYHMPRAVGVFCKQDWPVLPWPVDHQTSPASLLRLELNLAGNLGLLSRATREWAGLLAYFLSGKIASPLPGDCQPVG